ncbi:hypothetical protein C4D60_Mb05t25780 [Musa balbisiana]|uniref:RING-type E3 ubiquitin transferase BRCA1 n=1 Tax=Musa balbisiana TaxID=52838 RepID=A0A4V4H8F3_MUSBA|nr:hypothetical protein C4D60_Mb05t25780 [Musa balbisiana]
MDVIEAFRSMSWEQESYPAYEDFLALPFFALFFPTIRFFLDRFVFKKLAMRLIPQTVPKDFGAENERRRKINKFKESAWKCVYFLSGELLALSVTYNEPWFMSTRYFWVGPGDQVWPDQKIKLKLKAVYMYVAGFYTYSIFALIFWETRRSDFGVSMSHHVATAILIALSYIFRFARVGSIVLAIHDASDVFLEVGKMSKYSGSEWLANASFLLFVASWVLLRLTYFPFWILRSTSYEVLLTLDKAKHKFEGPIYYYVFNTLLFSLLVLHIYWWVLIYRMLVKQIQSRGHVGDDVRSGNGIRPIQGMESVVATVSGYHGTERFKLIKLIAQTGASYTGAMTKSTTHLVCWQFEGKKYDMARRTGAHIISHRWFEDCLKERKRLPEDPYAAQSGQEAGPITWEVPASLDTSGKGKSIISTERCMLSDNFSALNCRNIVEIDASYLDWSDSQLLHKCRESSTFPKVCSSSKKRNLFDATQDVVTCKPTRRSNRLKKKAYCNLLNYVSLGQKEGTSVKKFTSQLEIIDLDSTGENTSRRRLGSSSQGKTTDSMLSDREGSGIERLEQDGVEELRNDNILSDNGIFSDNENFECIGKMLGCSENARNDNEHHKEGENLYEAGAYKQAELSCVICWTEFSTTRAVLPCGHRFCYSCIQGWVDCLASRGKISSCPLCKSSFTRMRKMDTSTDQKIYSQTIPSESSNVDIIMVSNNGNDSARASMPMDPVCSECHNREPEDLLLCCCICESQWVHSYCLDPPVSPWTCIHCRDLRTLYQRFR